jgi:hypothetical protein
VETLPPNERVRYLELNAELPARIGQLAHSWTDALPTEVAKARALEEHLRKEFRYDLASPSGGKKQPIDDFLFDSHRGHCEFFSTAMAIMLREIGIPSRNVTGFVGGTFNRFGKYYAVREADAHSWVEAYIEDSAHPTWMTFDPTPSAGAQPQEATTGFWVYARDLLEAVSSSWTRYVIGYDLNVQMRLFDDVSGRYERLRRKTGLDSGPMEKVTRAPVLAVASLVAFAIAYTLWRRRRAQAASLPRAERGAPDANGETATTLFRSLEGALASNGITRPASLPPLRHAEGLHARRHPLAPEVLALTQIYLGARFGGAPLDEAAQRDFQKRVRQVRAWRPRPQADGATV